MTATYIVALTVADADGRSGSEEYPAETPERVAFVIRMRTRTLALAEDKWAAVWLWIDAGSYALVRQLRRGELVHLTWQLEEVGARVEWTVRPVLNGVPVQGPAWLAPVKEAIR